MNRALLKEPRNLEKLIIEKSGTEGQKNKRSLDGKSIRISKKSYLKIILNIKKKSGMSGKNEKLNNENLEGMKSMINNVEITPPQAKNENQASMLPETSAIRTEGLQVLSKLSEMDESSPESLLIGQAQRYSNVAHSFIEEREKAYLNDNLDNLPVNPSDFSIDAVCKLAEQARENIKLALEIRNSNVRNFKTIVEALKIKA